MIEISQKPTFILLLLFLFCNWLSPTRQVLALSNQSPNRPAGIYEGESVVLTGSTGFVGLRTLKSLLTHTKVDYIILPIRVRGDIRDKRAAVDRFSDVLAKYGEGLELSTKNPKLCFVPMSSGKYLDGIAGAPKRILDKCSTILHIAGSTDWNTPLDEYISANMEPTMELLQGSSDLLPNLKSFLYSSTCFAEDRDNVSRDTPVKEGPLAKVSDNSNYFSNYAKGKAMTEHAIESWVQSRLLNQVNGETEVDSIRVVILRPGTVAPYMGLDNVPVGWHTDTKSLAAGIKLSHSSSIFGKVMKTFYARKGVDTGIIPVDHVANMIVLAGGNCNLKGINGKPFYLNACSPSKREAKWDTLYERDAVMVPEDLSIYENDLKEAFVKG